MQTVLGLDLATKTGWALADSRGRILESGVQDFTKRRGESNGLLFLRFRKWLTELVRTANPGLIAYERAHFRGGAATELCVGLQTRAQEIAAEFQLESAPVTTGTLKKFAVGVGSASKEQMILAAAKQLGRDPLDDNEADAVHVAQWAVNEYLVTEEK